MLKMGVHRLAYLIHLSLLQWMEWMDLPGHRTGSIQLSSVSATEQVVPRMPPSTMSFNIY